jgi:hypothetical protein
MESSNAKTPALYALELKNSKDKDEERKDSK